MYSAPPGPSRGIVGQAYQSTPNRDVRTMSTPTGRDPVSILMEYGQNRRIKIEHDVLFMIGDSHRPSFLCRWRIANGQAFPAVFAPTKKQGKKDSAVIALEGLKVFPPGQRSFLNFWQKGQVLAIVDKMTVSGLDAAMFSALEDNQEGNSIISSQGGDSGLGGLSSGAYESGPHSSGGLYGSAPPSAAAQPSVYHTFSGAPNMGTMLDSYALSQPYSHQQEMMQQPRPPPKMKPPTLGALAEPQAKTMQAFDSMTIQTLASRTAIPAAIQDDEKNSLDLASTLATSFMLEPQNSYYKPKPAPDLMLGGDAPSPLTANSCFVQSQTRQPQLGEGLKQAVDAAMEVDSGKNAISELHEIGQTLGIKPTFEILDTEGPPHCPIFTCRCEFGGYEEITKAHSKDKGKRMAFISVLEKVKADGKLLTTSVPADSGRCTEKNPISQVNELGNKLSIVPVFEFTQMRYLPTPLFQCICKFGDMTFGPVEALNKPTAKTEVATMAIESLERDQSVDALISIQTHRISTPAGPSSATNGHSGNAYLNHQDVQNVLNQKHPISAFYEYAQARHLKAEFVEMGVSGPAHCKSFTYKCTLNGNSYPEATARKKADARKDAAELALREIYGAAPQGRGSPTSNSSATNTADATITLAPSASLSKSDRIAQAVLSKFNNLKAGCNGDLGKVILAGFVLENVNDPGTSSVISIGTGNRCISGSHLSRDGSSVNDCHAEVIARRGLVRFLYDQLENDKPDTPKSIFTQRSADHKLSLKKNLKLHLYISTAPCGDGALFTHNEAEIDLSEYNMYDPHEPTNEMTTEGLLRSKLEGGEGTIPTGQRGGSVVQTYDGITRGDVRLKTMSCSDKICKWNILGVQGTLLSDVIEPIYIESLVLGQLFHPGHLSRALCCRVSQLQEYLTQKGVDNFKVNHIKIACTSQQLPRSTAKSKQTSLNWMMRDEALELLDGENGLVIPVDTRDTASMENRTSRVSRKCLFSSYSKLKSAAITEHYDEVKSAIKQYTELKHKLYDTFSELQLGVWMKKPDEQNQFISK